MTATKTDPHQAWVTAPRDQELERFRVYYATRFPAPTDRAAGLTARCAATTQEAGTS